MRIFKAISFGLLLSGCVSYAQTQKSICFGQSLDLVLEKCRTLKSGPISVVIENDLKTISVSRDGKQRWTRKIINDENADIKGKPRIRYIKIYGEKLVVFSGSDSIDTLWVKNGKWCK